MNFTIVEGKYANLDSIHDDFCNDYLWSNQLSNVEIRKKYELTVGEFNELSCKVKAEHGLSRRPTRRVRGKYYYRHKYGFRIEKSIGNKSYYLGFVPLEEVAKKVVELCILADWNIPVCRTIVKNWRCYVGSQCVRGSSCAY